MPYSQLSFLSARNSLAQRLNDPNKIYWTDAELKLYVADALRFYNCLTGDNKQKYPLSIPVSNPVWFDLQTISGSPRQATFTDQNIYLRLTYQLLEPPSSTAVIASNQFSQDDLVQAVQRKRDEFLFKTGCTSVVETLPVTPNVSTIVLPQNVSQARRGYWLPNSGTAFPVFKTDEFATSCFAPQDAFSPGQPRSFSAGVEPPLSLELVPPPDRAGTLECLAIESQGVLSPAQATTLLLPSDFAPALTWGSLADLLSSGMEKQDLPRAQYARQRFDEYVQLMGAYPFVFSSKVNGVPLAVDAVESLDAFSPAWRTTVANPLNLGLSGQNLVAFPTNQAMQIVLLLCANAAIPVVDGDFIQDDAATLDCLLDEAQSIAVCKMGGVEAAQAADLHGNIIKLAAERRSKIRAMSCFSDILYGRTQRENQMAPMESVAE
jgi:hypothetical protein